MKEPIADTEPLAPLEFGPFGRILAPVTKWMAIAGGLVFVALVIMSIISIVGRKLGAGPVPGDVELLQMWAAFASACFLAGVDWPSLDGTGFCSSDHCGRVHVS